MTNTELKLDEAKFFLEKLDTQDSHFDYYLSAFLNAARSTTWIMRNEFQNIKGWEKWYNSIEVTKESKNLLNKINDFRILSTKQSGIKTEFLLFDTFHISDEEYQKFLGLTEEPGEYTITISDFDESNATNNSESSFITRIDSSRQSSLPSRIEMIELGKEYLDLLTQLVSACIKKFSTEK